LLSDTQASRATFCAAILRSADLSNASLNGARFRGAHLPGAFLIGAKLVAADFSELKHGPAALDRADLTDTCRVGFPNIRLCNATFDSNGWCLCPEFITSRILTLIE
jgi:uncharacterized protein YjbI with pentapeptide repeats